MTDLKYLNDERKFLINLENIINKLDIIEDDKNELLKDIYIRHREINKLINKNKSIDI